MTAAGPIPAGHSLGHYRIGSLIGEGGMGAVYRAHDPRLDREVAIKVITPRLLEDQQARKRFQREALAISKLTHPNVEVLYDIGREGDLDYIVLEYVPGNTLDTLLRKGPLEPAQVVDLGRQLLSGLGAAHKSGLLHRDMKPSNIRVTPEGQLKILDFGLAKVIHATPDAMTQSELTGEVMLGTVPYMAPEQLRGQPLSERTDLFAAGAVLYEMATGKPPFSGTTQVELVDRILNKAPAPPRSLNPKIPARLGEAILRALEKEPAQRYASAKEFAEALEAAQPRRVAGRRWALVAPLAVVLAVAAIAAWRWHGGRAPSPTAPADKTLTLDAPGRARLSANPEANDAYQRALVLLLTQSNVNGARKLLEDALRADPHFAQARAWYGFTDVLMIDTGLSADTSWLYKAEQELRQAMADDPRCARAHSALAAAYYYEGRHEEMLAELKRSQELGSDYDTYIWYGVLYQLRGQYEKSNAAFRVILQQNEFFFPARMNMAENARQRGDPETAIRENSKILEVDPRNIYALQGIALAKLNQGKAEEARALLQKAMADPEVKENYNIRIAWALVLAQEGKKSEARKALSPDVIKAMSLFPSQVLSLAEFYALLGDKEQALEWLERAVAKGDDRAEWFQRDPMLKSLQSEPRFRQLIESIEYRAKQRKD